MVEFTSVFFVYGVVAAVLLQCAAAKTVHVVGDSLGWTIPRDSPSAYASWAASKKFVVGDILTFNFTSGEHDVLQVPKESYDSCSASNPIGNTITTGPINITLSNTENHYYICTFSQHCQLGQRLTITVSSSLGAAPPSTNSPPPPLPTTPSPPSGTPADCTPTPASSPTSSPKANGPKDSTQTDPGTSSPPDYSSSSGVFASFLVSILSIAMCYLF